MVWRRKWVLWLGLLLGFDLLWLLLDRSVPAWDQGDHLGRALTYAQVWGDPQWRSGVWWLQMWRLSPSYRAPLLYLVTVPVFALLGAGWHQGMVVNTLMSLPLLGLVGTWLGGWGGWVLFIPYLLEMRTTYLLDYPLMVVVTATWLGLSRWRQAVGIPAWGWAGAWGLGLGLTVLTRPTGILFFVLPLAGALIEVFVQKRFQGQRWQRLGQGIGAALVALLISGFWVQANWLTILTSIDKARAWGDLYQQTGIPAGWFYLTWLPNYFGWPLLLLGGLGWVLGRYLPKTGDPEPQPIGDWKWVGLFLVGGYGLCAFSPSYDPRFLLPIVPVLAGILVAGVLRLGWRWRWIGLGLSLGMSLIPQFFAAPAPDYRGGWPHPEVIQTVIDQAPWQRSTVGVVASTAEVNPFNINFYGNLRQFQVYGRQLSFDPDPAVAWAESQALDWYLTKTGSQTHVPIASVEDGQFLQWQTVSRNPALERLQTWPLPDRSTLELWHRRAPHLQVAPIPRSHDHPVPVLVSVSVPERAEVGKVIPVTYRWQGSPTVLSQGVVLVDWQDEEGHRWIQDHAIGLGNLFLGRELGREGEHPLAAAFQVEERLGMGIPTHPGRYTLNVRYLRDQQEVSVPLPTPVGIPITDPLPSPHRDPEVLDTLSLFRHLAQPLRAGSLDAVFREVARINQHDPTQAYYAQLEASLSYRVRQDPHDLESAYSLMLVQVLQQKALAALTTLEGITATDAQNPYAWIYQAVVYLYRWQGSQARHALLQAQSLNPGIPEIPLLLRVAALQTLDVAGVIRQP